MPGHADYKGWTEGENNRLRAQELTPEQLRRCVNFDVSNTGHLTRRRGSTSVYSGSIQPGSLYSNGKRVLFVESGSLWELDKTTSGWRRLLVRLNVGALPMQYLDVAGDIYWSNGVNTGIFTADGQDLPWGLHAPVEQPNLVASSNGGSMTGGAYQVAITFVSDRGEESGTDLAREITVASTSTGSIEIRDIPTSTEATTVNIYCSHPNGEGLYRVGSLLSGIPTYRITAIDNASDRRLETQFGTKPPAGHILEYHNGRIYCALGQVVWYTDPLRYGLVRQHRNFLLYPAPVTVMKAVEDGIYLCADQTYFITGVDTDQFAQREVLPYGAVKGTGIDLGKTKQVAWFSDYGFVVAGLQGQVKNLSEERSAVSRFTSGSMLFREQRGLRQLIATLDGAEQSAFLADDYVQLETTRRGNAL